MSDIANAIVGCLWIVLFGYWVISARGTKRTLWGKGDLWFQIWFRVALVVMAVLLSKRPDLWRPMVYGHLIAPNSISLSAGVTVCALGLGFAMWARLHLGSNWGLPMSVRENPDLVTSGPYGIVRNPIYSGILLAELGSAMVAGNVWFLMFAVCLPYFIYASMKEGKLMSQQFPDQYSDYRGRTKMLVPFLF